MKKKLTALFLAAVMCMTLCVPSFAVEKEITVTPIQSEREDEIRAEIRRQLEAQDAMELYDAFVELLAPDDVAQTYGVNATPVSYYAPEGGSTYFTRPYTYRGEEGVYTYLIHHFDENDTDRLVANMNSMKSTIEFLDELYSLATEDPIPTIPTIQEILIDAGKTALLDSVLYSFDFSLSEIENAGGYAKITTIESSIDGGAATIVLGWEDYPYAVIEHTDAANRVFEYYPSN